MFDVALTVAACLRAGTRARVVWILDSAGLPPHDTGEALVLTPGGGRSGGLAGGALDEIVAGTAAEGDGRIVEVTVDQIGALLSGLPEGARVRCVVADAQDYPAPLWAELIQGRPVGLVQHLDDGRLGRMELFTASDIERAGDAAAGLFARSTTAAELVGNRIVSVWWPVPRLVLVGGGPIADALAAAAGLLGWRVLRFEQPAPAVAAISGLTAMDAVVVTAHELNLAGEALQAAVAGRTGYIAALGSQAMAQRRREWLLARQVEDVDRIHSPAGLDIGARRPPEVAVAVLAQALAVLSAGPVRSGVSRAPS